MPCSGGDLNLDPVKHKWQSSVLFWFNWRNIALFWLNIACNVRILLYRRYLVMLAWVAWQTSTSHEWWHFCKISLLHHSNELSHQATVLYNVHTRYRPRLFDQVGHQTTSAYVENKHFFTKSCHRQTYQNYEQPPQSLQNL